MATILLALRPPRPRNLLGTLGYSKGFSGVQHESETGDIEFRAPPLARQISCWTSTARAPAAAGEKLMR